MYPHVGVQCVGVQIAHVLRHVYPQQVLDWVIVHKAQPRLCTLKCVCIGLHKAQL